METSFAYLSRACRMLAIAFLMSSVGARGEGLYTGVEKIMWPAIIIASPFVVVHDLIFGSDERSRRSAEKDADRILEKTPGSISVTGLYTGSVDLRWALYGMLVESRLPFVEINTAGSAWLLSQSKDPAALIPLAEQHPYVRLALGSQGNPACFSWKSSNDDWTANPPVRPRTCLLIQFVDELQSDLALSVDASEVRHRKLRWNLVDRATGNMRLSLPFWVSQVEGQPLFVSATYRVAHENYPFAKVIKKLAPTFVPTGQDGRPYLMTRIDADAIQRSERDVKATAIAASFRPPTFDWTTAAGGGRNERWIEGYDRAETTGLPTMHNNFWLILPQQDLIRPVCIEPGGSSRSCTFVHNFLTAAGVLTFWVGPSYRDTSPPGPMSPATSSHPMYLLLTGRRPEGDLLWYVRIVPAELPESIQLCNDFSKSCAFYPRQATTTSQELIVRGTFRDDPTSMRLPRDEFELVVPLSRLPPVARSRPPGMN